MKAMSNLIPWDDIIEVRSVFSTWLANLYLLLVLKWISIEGKSFSKVLIGEYRSWYHRVYLNSLSPDECYLLDDGNITIEIQRRWLPNGDYPYTTLGVRGMVKQLVQSGMLLILGLKGFEVRNDINLFTCFDLEAHCPEQIIVRHEFAYLKQNCSKRETRRDEVYFIGGKLSEASIISFDVEVELLGKIAKYYLNRGKRLIYVPHRQDSIQKIAHIREAMQIPIRQFRTPAEVEFAQMEALPYGIASFFSTALYTLSKIFDFGCVDAFRISPIYIEDKFRLGIETVYQEYKKHLNLVELDEIL
jgi:hypothetical protein